MKDNQLQTYKHPELGEIQGFIKDGEPWFLAGKICRSLGIKDASTAVAQVTQRLKIAEYKGAVSNRILLNTAGGKQSVTIIPEPYLYELIFASRKKKAIVFRTWVTTEVLPEIRKHGSYRMKGKMFRLSLTDAIKESGENDRMHGHGYSTYTKLINKSLGLPTKNNKDELSPDTLEKLAVRENLVNALINEGKEYHEIKEILQKAQEQVILKGGKSV
jgi:prophage antirepressor-like protein